MMEAGNLLRQMRGLYYFVVTIVKPRIDYEINLLTRSLPREFTKILVRNGGERPRE